MNGLSPYRDDSLKKGEPNTLPNRDTLRVAHDPPGSSLALRGLGVDFVPWSIIGDREAPQMQARDEIVKQIDKLSPEMQQQVLRFVASLAASMPKGECGAVLRQFSGSLDAVSAQQMIQAIEEEFERVDASEW